MVPLSLFSFEALERKQKIKTGLHQDHGRQNLHSFRAIPINSHVSRNGLCTREVGEKSQVHGHKDQQHTETEHTLYEKQENSGEVEPDWLGI